MTAPCSDCGWAPVIPSGLIDPAELMPCEALCCPVWPNEVMELLVLPPGPEDGEAPGNVRAPGRAEALGSVGVEITL